MRQDEQHASDDRDEPPGDYRPPTVTFLGTLADLTQKTVGDSDGTTFLGQDIAS